MAKIKGRSIEGQAIYMGIDVHEKTYRVSLFYNGEEILNKPYPAEYKYLRRLLDRFKACIIHAVYEAGAFGYGLYDKMKLDGVKVSVTPPSKIPREPGERVKNDKRDCRKLAQLLSSNVLRSVSVPSKRIREDRDLLRTRDQLVSQRRRVFMQIQSKLRFHGLSLRFKGVISKRGQDELLSLPGPSDSLQISFQFLLDTYKYYTEQLKNIRKAVLSLCEAKRYKGMVELLKSIPGIGNLVALSWVLELPKMSRFKDNERLASYLGLTTSEWSSGEHHRQGRITRCGNAKIRWLLVESSWWLIKGDKAIQAFYDRVKRRRGGKRAIVGVARKLSGRIRTILLRREKYALGTIA